MLCPAYRIAIGDIVLTEPASLHLEHTWERLTNFGDVKIPRLFEWRGMPVATGTQSIFRRGMPVTVEAGFGTLKEEFTGFVSGVKIGDLLTIRVEDPMYLLKQRPFRSAYLGTTVHLSLERLMADLMKGTGLDYRINLDVPDLGNWDIKGKPNVAQVLEHLRTRYHIYSMFRGGVLHIGRPYATGVEQTHTLEIGKHVGNDTDLEYFSRDDRRVKLVVYAADRKGLEVVAHGSDEDGDQIRIPSFHTTRASLQAHADRALPEYKWEGLAGILPALGEPRVQEGDTITLVNPIYPDRSGSYRIKRVDKDGSPTGGYTRRLHLHQKVG